MFERKPMNEPLSLSVKFLAPCQGGLAVWLGPSAFRRLAIFKTISIFLTRGHSAQDTPLVGFLSLLKFLRKLSWLNGLAESFCGEAWFSAVDCCQGYVQVTVEARGHTISRSEICLGYAGV